MIKKEKKHRKAQRRKEISVIPLKGDNHQNIYLLKGEKTKF